MPAHCKNLWNFIFRVTNYWTSFRSIHDEDPQSTRGGFLNRYSGDIDERDSDCSEVSSESAKLSSVPTDQDCCGVDAITNSTGCELSLSWRYYHTFSSVFLDSSLRGDKDYSQLDGAEKKTRRRARTNSIPTRPTQLGMENVSIVRLSWIPIPSAAHQVCVAIFRRVSCRPVVLSFLGRSFTSMHPPPISHFTSLLHSWHVVLAVDRWLHSRFLRNHSLTFTDIPSLSSGQ